MRFCIPLGVAIVLLWRGGVGAEEEAFYTSKHNDKLCGERFEFSRGQIFSNLHLGRQLENMHYLQK